ncbi:GNAT family N-acetyltransferase [Lactococcus termiticola]|uniref:GNAT family acetyltransferase n=1 Tax=Lactococcus termiticola TaxID=2169526 RepID=A0A2R5HEK6_9LACT|nr:GNAT family N-acetyltransferase [Lactococcus termiticola]GBG96514.1 GNAT family acetyltransferase [Lactococcus termiticola]
MIYLRKAEPKDISEIMKLIQEARLFLAASGSDQWQGAYPALADIERDLLLSQGHVLVSGDKIAAYASVIAGEEPAYSKMTQGSWSNSSRDYVTIHRIAASKAFRGQHLTQFLFSNIFNLMAAKGYRDFRVDTHPANLIMQHIFEREGFVKRGLVDINGVRIAYQKELV